ncbi:Hypothetical predicted protein [Mytilus galloprovincialis]|uniref:C3H1-type domain-containing protein n=1 Tax=Mytilus galloprovincialis TaxID=29158 RepID=A0A8B6F7P6_MYTGA|nr:Hypothetical predicted protein [Mytilus galloprovincialis]
MHSIRLGAKRCALGWKSYDEQFRLRMSQDPAGSWAVVDPELWLLYMYPPSSNSNAPVSTGRFKCYAFNYQGNCVNQSCPYNHSCLRCSDQHPLIQCPRQNVFPNRVGGNARFQQPRPQFRPRFQARGGNPVQYPNNTKSYSESKLLRHLWDKGWTPINILELNTYLGDYANRVDAQLLLEGFTFGFRIQYEGPRISTTAKKFGFCRNTQVRNISKVARRGQTGRILGPFSKKPISTLRISPIGLVQKPDKWLASHISFVLSKWSQSPGLDTLDHYLDDFIFAGHESNNNCELLMDTFMKVCKDLCVPLADNKTVGPTTTLTFLGLEIDTLLMLVIRFRTLAPEADQTPSDIPVEFHMVISELK